MSIKVFKCWNPRRSVGQDTVDVWEGLESCQIVLFQGRRSNPSWSEEEMTVIVITDTSLIKNQQIHVQMFQVETLASVLLGFALWIVRVNVGIKHHPTSAKIPKTGHLPTVHLQLRRVEKRVLVWSPPQPTAPRRGRPAGPISMTNSQWSGTNLGLWSPLEKWCKMVQGC